MKEKRFFNQEQRQSASHVCEMGDPLTPCVSPKLEADHATAYSKGGQTEIDNLIMLCTVHHAVKHCMDEEPYAAQLVVNRMTEQEYEAYATVMRGLSYPYPQR